MEVKKIMFSAFSSGALATKIKAHYGKHLTENQYNELMHKHSVAEAAGYLKSQPGYTEIFKDIQETNARRGQIENILRRSEFFQYLELLNYNFDGKESFYASLIRRYEVEQILQKVQAINSGETVAYVAQVPTFISSYALFDFMSLSTVQDFDALMSKLKKTPYCKILLPLRPQNGQLIDYAACEQILYAHYYQELCNTIKNSFSGEQQKQLLYIISCQVELRDLEIIYRLIRFYDMPSEKIRHYLLPEIKTDGYIRSKLMEKFLSASSAEQFMEFFKASPYKNFIPENSPSLEYSIAYIQYRLLSKKLAFSSYTPVIFIAYQFLSEIQIQNVITVIEGIRYQLDPDEIKKLVVQ